MFKFIFAPKKVRRDLFLDYLLFLCILCLAHSVAQMLKEICAPMLWVLMLAAEDCWRCYLLPRKVLYLH